LLTFSFFLFFVIRPNLVNVFSLQEELGRLRLLDTGYENVIKKIISIQTFLETNRSDLYLLDQSISSSPQINKIVNDLEAAATSSGIILTQIDISEVDLKKNVKQKETNKLVVNLSTQSDFEQAKQFIETLFIQRRLKTLKHLIIDRAENTGSGSALLKIKLELEGYYL
jgi:Tfp pilus assembly protein PilO